MKTTMTALLTEIIGILVGGITEFGKGIGAGLSSLVNAIFIDSTGDTTKLSIFGGVIVIFAAIALAVGLSRWVVNFVTSLGH